MQDNRQFGYTYPFIYGAQYYRAPTPDRRHWAGDLRRMSESGFNAVKFWAQWRWSHRTPGEFYYDDLDELMDLAAQNGLSVTINVIYDVAPTWLFRDYPDCRMVTQDGRTVEPRAVAYRQIGGHPGPCYNHSEARRLRDEFTQSVVSRYADHPAMGMWDMWNEPEICSFYREPRLDTLLCYCPSCLREFKEWLQGRYGNIESLNKVWGRFYSSWDDVELPRDRGSFSDMIDWRLFCLDVLALEARTRLETARSIDVNHPVYLHPVPNTMTCFNSITGVDDFQLAQDCDCFGGTTNGVPVMTIQNVSSAQGRVCYNVESHLRAGSTAMYPRDLGLSDFANTFVPQIGLGIRGFLHWQYRAETLGAESPAWGLLDTDGEPGHTHCAASEFWHRLSPVAQKLMSAEPEAPEAAILKSKGNEILHWCMHGSFHDLSAAVEGYTQLLYGKNVRVSYVSEEMLTEGLNPGIRLLVLPDCYALSRPAADALASWVEAGGTLICEAHLGGYDLSSHRHGEILPGLGLSERFGLRERNATAVPHLGVSEPTSLGGQVLGDLAKAIQAFGLSGGMILYLNLESGRMLLGWSRYAEIKGDGISPIAGLPGRPPCAVSKEVGNGTVYYLGTLAGRMWASGQTPGLEEIVDMALRSAGIQHQSERFPWLPANVRANVLRTQDGDVMTLWNRSDHSVKLSIPGGRGLTGIFIRHDLSDGKPLVLSPGDAELLVPMEWL